MRTCGGCTECCTLIGVQEIGKPENTPCQHCTGTGCGIYETRPTVCAGFACLWLGSEPEAAAAISGISEENLRAVFPQPLPQALRPDRSHVILTFGESADEPGRQAPDGGLIVFVDPKFPKARHRPEVRKFLHAYLKLKGYYMHVVGDDRRIVMLVPDNRGGVEERMFTHDQLQEWAVENGKLPAPPKITYLDEEGPNEKEEERAKG